MDTNEIRKANLKRLIDEQYGGVVARFANQVEKQPAYISSCLTQNETHKRNIGEKIAREFERKTGMPSGWLDKPEDNNASAFTPDLIPKEVEELLIAVMDSYRRDALSPEIAKAQIQLFRALSGAHTSTKSPTQQRGPQLDANGKVIMGNESGVEEAIFSLNEQPQKKVG